MRLRGKTALITGASKGIGRATAVAFAREGAGVAMLGTDDEAGEGAAAACREHGSDAAWLRTDLARETEIVAAVEATTKRFGTIDVLVNNAGVHGTGTALTISSEAWDALMRVNVTAAFLCAKHVIPYMQAGEGGSVINVSSEAGMVGMAGQTAYNASKAALISLTQSMALDFADTGVRVNCVCPGTTLTPLVQNLAARSKDPDSMLRALAAVRPQKRLGRPAEIAEAILFFASDECRYATGAVLAVDGGYTAQ